MQLFRLYSKEAKEISSIELAVPMNPDENQKPGNLGINRVFGKVLAEIVRFFYLLTRRGAGRFVLTSAAPPLRGGPTK